MTCRALAARGALAAAALCASTGSCAARPVPAPAGVVNQEVSVVTRASGTFEVKLTPQTAGDDVEVAKLGRMAIDKQFRGDLEGTSMGTMLAAHGSVKGSAGYVAMERVSGTLHGRRGTFVLQHTGTMTRGAPQLSVTVVPDTGTEELAGLAGAMTIIIEGGKHSYELDYTLPKAP